MPTAPRAVVSWFAALVRVPLHLRFSYLPRRRRPRWHDDNTLPISHPPLSPRQPKTKPGPRSQATADLSRKFSSSATDRTREKRAFTTAFKLGALSYATHGRIDNSKGGLRSPTAKEVYKRYNLKHTRYLHRWRQEEVLLLMKPSQKRHRPSCGHWPKQEKALVLAFADRRKKEIAGVSNALENGLVKRIDALLQRVHIP